jgi:hypothetical protein
LLASPQLPSSKAARVHHRRARRRPDARRDGTRDQIRRQGRCRRESDRRAVSDEPSVGRFVAIEGRSPRSNRPGGASGLRRPEPLPTGARRWTHLGEEVRALGFVRPRGYDACPVHGGRLRSEADSGRRARVAGGTSRSRSTRDLLHGVAAPLRRRKETVAALSDDASAGERRIRTVLRGSTRPSRAAIHYLSNHQNNGRRTRRRSAASQQQTKVDDRCGS